MRGYCGMAWFMLVLAFITGTASYSNFVDIPQWVSTIGAWLSNHVTANVFFGFMWGGICLHVLAFVYRLVKLCRKGEPK